MPKTESPTEDDFEGGYSHVSGVIPWSTEESTRPHREAVICDRGGKGLPGSRIEELRARYLAASMTCVNSEQTEPVIRNASLPMRVSLARGQNPTASFLRVGETEPM